MKNEIAILMAAGFGSRMRPLTLTTPKPLITVDGKPLIETVIDGLNKRGIKRIDVVTGYLGEQFDYLKEKYDNVRLIANTEYESKNNISSVYAVRDSLGEADCFICEADLYVRDDSLFDVELNQSCYFGKMVEGYSDDWVFTMDGDKISHIGKGGSDTYNMVGVAYLKKEDAIILKGALEEEYKKDGHENLFWDEIADKCLNRFTLGIHEISGNELIEIDTVEELEEVRRQIEK